MVSRRGFAFGASAAILAPRLVLAQDAAGVPILTAEKSEMQLVNGGGKTPVWRFMNEAPVAVLRATQGQPFKLQFSNKLDGEIALHWFGIRGPEAMMTVFANPDDAAPTEIEFTPPDAGTFWFGPLIHASQQRDMGLYGLFHN